MLLKLDHRVFDYLNVRLIAYLSDFLGQIIISQRKVVNNRNVLVLLCSLWEKIGSFLAMVNHLVAYLFCDFGDQIVFFFTDEVQKIESIVFAQMPVELWGRAQANENP